MRVVVDSNIIFSALLFKNSKIIDALVWTGDKKLRECLTKKGFNKFADLELLAG